MDRHDQTVRVVRLGEPDFVAHDRVEWRPAGTTEALVIDLAALFHEAQDD